MDQSDADSGEERMFPVVAEGQAACFPSGAFIEGNILHEHLALADASAKRDIDCLAKMKALTVLMEKQLGNLYAHQARSTNPFLFQKQVEQAALLYMQSLERLQKMQMAEKFSKHPAEHTDTALSELLDTLAVFGK